MATGGGAGGSFPGFQVTVRGNWLGAEAWNSLPAAYLDLDLGNSRAETYHWFLQLGLS